MPAPTPTPAPPPQAQNSNGWGPAVTEGFKSVVGNIITYVLKVPAPISTVAPTLLDPDNAEIIFGTTKAIMERNKKLQEALDSVDDGVIPPPPPPPPQGSTTEISPGFSLTGTDETQFQVFLQEGSTFEFSWLFDAGDYMPYNDYAYWSVNGEQITLSSVSQVGDYGNSGYNNALFTADTEGSYDFGFGISDVGDGLLPSTLTVSNVTVTDYFVMG